MKINKSMVILFVSLSFAIGLIYYVYTKYPLDQVISALKNVTPVTIIAFLVVSFLIMLCFTWRWKILLEAQGHKNLKMYELFSYRIIDYGVSYLTPTAKIAGEPVRAAMLMRNGISFKEGLTTITIDKTIELSFTVIMFVIGCFLLILSNALSGGAAVFLVLLCAFLIFLNWMFYYRILQGEPIFLGLFRFFHLDKVKRLSKYQLAIYDFEKPILDFYARKKVAYFKALGLTVFAFCLSMVEFGLLLIMVGVEPTLKQTFMVFSVLGISFLIPVPMGLGSTEAMQAWLFSSLGLNSAAGVGLAMIARARDLIWVVFAIGFALYYGSLKKVLSEAFNSKFTNQVVKMTVFRGGKEANIDIKMFRKKGSPELPFSKKYLIFKERIKIAFSKWGKR